MLLLEGRPVANAIYKSLNPEIVSLKDRGIVPCLQVIIIGERADSLLYVKMKKKQADKLGLLTEITYMDVNTTTYKVMELIETFNADENVHGILIQLPLPKHLDTNKILDSVLSSKDVDGFHQNNFGKLALNQDTDTSFAPCTAVACLEMLDHYKIPIRGSNIVIVGASRVIGLPVSLLLLNRGATVTICHIDTINVKSHTEQADIIISACGQSLMITKGWAKKDSVIIDVGINKINYYSFENGDQIKKEKIVGDVNLTELQDCCQAISPVPRGVGPVTIAVLMKQLVKAAKINSCI